MALLGAFIDSRTLVALTTADTVTYAHGLPAAPDVVIVQENTTTNNTSNLKFCVKADATNVSVWNYGEAASATLNSVAVVFHSIVR